jgi:hypothetical protein
MGSAPWVRAFLNMLVDDYSGKRVEVRTRGPVYAFDGEDRRPAVDGYVQERDEKRVTGRYVGDGTTSGRHCLIVSTAPEGMEVRHPDYFDYERWIAVSRDADIRVRELGQDAVRVFGRPGGWGP